MSKSTVDLNQWECVDEDGIKDDHDILKLIPQKIGKMQPDPIYYIKPKADSTYVKNIEGVTWNPQLIISKSGTDSEYAARVNWWMGEAKGNDEYKATLKTAFEKNGFSIVDEWDKARAWLIGRSEAARKTHLRRFIFNWMQRNYAKHVSNRRYKR